MAKGSTGMQIVFSMAGWCEQELMIMDDDYSPQDIVDMLNNNQAFTSLQEGGDIIVLNKDFAAIATIITTEPEGEYFDFELKNTWEND
jgi:hypothetical protein